MNSSDYVTGSTETYTALLDNKEHTLNSKTTFCSDCEMNLQTLYTHRKANPATWTRALSLCLCLCGLAVIQGCDVSSDNSGGTQSEAQDPDPVVVDFPIAYIERPIPRDEDGEIVPDDVLDPAAFNPGARILFKARAAVSAVELVLTEGVFPPTVPSVEELAEGIIAGEPLYDVKDLTVSSDGLKLLFAMRAPEDEDADEDEQPTWNIWEYDLEDNNLRRVIISDVAAEAGEDIDPHYLADGSIVFSSTRQRRSRAILLDENKPQFAALTEGGDEQENFVLHTMDIDGNTIKQISFNQSHDLAPMLLTSGELIFMRWDNYASANPNRLSLYKANPDGSNINRYYGYHSQNTGTNDSQAAWIDPIQMPNGLLLTGLRSRESNRFGGDLITLDAENFIEYSRAIDETASGETAQKSATSGVVKTDGSVSPRGYFNSAFPMHDGTNRLLVSWSACFVQGISLNIFINLNGELINDNGEFVGPGGGLLADDASPVIPAAEDIGSYPCTDKALALAEVAEAQPMFGLWTYDPALETQTPVVLAKEDTIYTEAVVMDELPNPAFIQPAAASEAAQALIDENVGVIHIHSVYDFHGIDNTENGIDAMADPMQTPASERPARFIRVLKSVSLPDEDVYDFDASAFGRSGGQMKDILGYVPVEPDGSVMFKVPADVSFTFSIVDANGRRVPDYLGNKHQNWLSVRPGETRECSGCHEAGNTEPHGRFDAEAPTANLGAIGSTHFPNTILLDAFDTPNSPPEAGETMAAYYSRMNSPRSPTVDIVFDDEWTDANVMAKSASYDLSYADLPSAAAPVSAGCQSNWNSLCRTVINYIDHIQPLWSLDRRILDDDGELIEDHTCTSCHSPRDANGQAKVPADQLELTSDQHDIQDDYFTSYAELFFGDIPEELVEGALVDQTQQVVDDAGNLVFDTDAEGELILDDEGEPIPTLETVAARGAYLSAAGARDNSQFYSLFVPGATHDSYVNAAELKLISEWLDIGTQYYNNPFDAPAN
ncbi:MAG: hypothetical protein ACI93R_002379 [Flavobacteriales bacterium]|jgi:hypothetical protein